MNHAGYGMTGYELFGYDGGAGNGGTTGENDMVKLERKITGAQLFEIVFPLRDFEGSFVTGMAAEIPASFLIYYKVSGNWVRGLYEVSNISELGTTGVYRVNVLTMALSGNGTRDAYSPVNITIKDHDEVIRWEAVEILVEDVDNITNQTTLNTIAGDITTIDTNVDTLITNLAACRLVVNDIHTTNDNVLKYVLAIFDGRCVVDPVTSIMTIYDRDNVSVLTQIHTTETARTRV